jgi:hypothetical protein
VALCIADKALSMALEDLIKVLHDTMAPYSESEDVLFDAFFDN